MRRGPVRRTAAICLVILLSGFAGGWGLSDELAEASRWRPDGAGPLTTWTHSYVDVPGLYVGDEHCHGRGRRVIQVGATDVALRGGCYPRRPYACCGGSYQELLELPFGRALVRRTQNGSGWNYSIEGRPRVP